ncbi:MAG TPA: condensation domain-containing protein [Actinoplanes sp.]|nr:condensation domain-containing protein [Actinoplanes sp.]
MTLDPRVEAAYAALTPGQRARLSLALAGSVAAAIPAHTGPPVVSSGQLRLWFLDQLRPGSAAYVVPLALRLDGPLDHAALSAALDAVVARHEILRTTYPARDGRPFARVAPALSVSMPVVETSDVARALRAEASRPFDLATGPLLRATLLRVAPDEHVLLLSQHHIVTDGWSLPLLVGELIDRYRGVAPVAAGASYADYAAWQRDRLDRGDLDGHVGFWRDRLRDVPALTLPPGPGAGTEISWPADLVAPLRELARAERATLFMALLAVVGAVLARATGRSEVVVGTTVAGRSRPELEGTLGFFVNTLPMPVSVAGDPTLRELIGQVRRTVLDGLAHADAPYERIAAGRARTALTSVLLTLRDTPPVIPGVTVLPAPVVEPKAPLGWELSEDGTGGLTGRFEHALRPGVAERLEREVRAVLAGGLRTGAAWLAADQPPTAEPSSGSAAGELPRDAVEALVVRIWAEILQTPSVGALDDFFDLGGHSLLATQAAARLQEALGLPVPLDGLLGLATARDLAGYLRDLGAAAGLDVEARAASGGPPIATVRRLERRAR